MPENDPYAKVSPGQRVRDTNSATRQNALVDAARLARGESLRFTDDVSSARRYDGTTGKVRNDTTVALPPYSILTLATVLVGPADNLATFQATPWLYSGAVPATSADNFCVSLDPLPKASGPLADAVLLGHVACIVDVQTNTDNFASPTAPYGMGSAYGGTVNLLSGPGGAVPIIYKSNEQIDIATGALVLSGGNPVVITTGVMWCVVALRPAAGYVTGVACTGSGLVVTFG